VPDINLGKLLWLNQPRDLQAMGFFTVLAQVFRERYRLFHRGAAAGFGRFAELLASR
jgi:hypothetical protein